MPRSFRYLVLCSAILFSACSTAPKAPSELSLLNDDYTLAVKYLQEFIPAQMKKYDFTGLSVALVDDQRIIWSEGFGYADKSAKTEATENTVYRAGSVSKLFTTMAVMKLVEDGKLDLDAPITESVPEFDLKTRFGSIDEITLRNILSHHAGIPSALYDGMWTNEPDSFKTVTAGLQDFYAAYPPNTVFAYSNAAYSVAGHAVENASEVPYTEFVKESLLRPLDMMNSNIEYDTSPKQLSKSYWEGKEVQELGLRDLPAGGLITTVGDLGNVIKMINANGSFRSALFTPDTVEKMLELQTYDSVYEPASYNAIGWMHHIGLLDDKYTAIGHDGQTMAHSASMVVVPELGLGVVLLANSPNISGGHHAILKEILRIVHPVKTGISLADVPKVEDTPLPGTETSFAGQYTSEAGFVDITEKSNGYQVKLTEGKLSLSKNDKGKYTLGVKLLGFIPLTPPELKDVYFSAREIDGEKLIIGQLDSVRFLAATPMEKQIQDPVWDARLGVYELSNPIQTDIELFKVNQASLVYSDGVYHLKFKTPMANQKLPLKIISDTQATLQGYGRGLGETVFVQPDGSLLHAGMVFVRKQ